MWWAEARRNEAADVPRPLPIGSHPAHRRGGLFLSASARMGNFLQGIYDCSGSGRRTPGRTMSFEIPVPGRDRPVVAVWPWKRFQRRYEREGGRRHGA